MNQNSSKINTIDHIKKPSIKYLILSLIICGGISAIFYNLNMSHSLIVVNLSNAAFFVVATVYLLVCLRRQLTSFPYSYNTIFYAGFSLFVFSLVPMYLHLVYICHTNDLDINEMTVLFDAVNSSALSYVFYSTPFLLIFSIALIISNIQLIRKEGKRFVNILGIILAILLIGGEAIIFYYDFYASGSLLQVEIHQCITQIMASIFLYFECMLIGTIIANAITSKIKVPRDIDVIIILGCGIRKDGTPTPLLQGRADRALQIYKDQVARTGKAPLLVPSGGQGEDEVISEAMSMRNYLLSMGIPEKDIVLEDRSTTTEENMEFSKAIISDYFAAGNQSANIKPDDLTIAFATTNYHVFRSGIFATDAGLRTTGVSAKTKWYFWPNAAVREFAGLLSRQKKKQAIIISIMVALYVISTIVLFSIME